MRRALRVELRRGTAPLAAVAMFGAGVWMLAVHPDDWAGRWAGLANYLRVSLLILCALMIAAGAWQSGRERRRDIDELIASTPRPGWQPLVMAWFAVTVAGVAGLLVAFAGAAVLVARVATYAGGGWWWTLTVGVLALAAAAAIGVLVGRLVPLRVAAPIAGLATYLGLAIITYWDGTPGAWLSPVYGGWAVYSRVPGRITALQAAWLVALTVLLLAAAARQQRAALLAGGLAVAVAVPITTGPGTHRLPADPAAVELVCTSSGPQMCLSRINAFLIDDVATVVQPILGRLDGIPGAPRRAADQAAQPAGQSIERDDGTVWLNLDYQSTALGGLASRKNLRADFRQVTRTRCEDPSGTRNIDMRVYRTDTLATDWMLDEAATPDDVPLTVLRALPEPAQRSWFAAYLDAAHRCDIPALIRLGEQP
ncbi:MULTISPECIES: hypothetical protein [Micromonospora]|uniref:ABC transporter permease n=2 Tax=Micromonospora TaxID=1873 RepID=A0ABQ6UPJ3_9ACTN|nr:MULTISPECIES: hypothetical protein [Micromonospora]KAB1118899.1 hypothetical protein F6X54_01645 [Micromonospora aurantiaca]MBQ1060924.1 hypothetical protein [Micromonospora sp. C41]RBJ11205.1 hypothetical protein DRA43_00840 [Micromonospora provocatoris]